MFIRLKTKLASIFSNLNIKIWKFEHRKIKKKHLLIAAPLIGLVIFGIIYLGMNWKVIFNRFDSISTEYYLVTKVQSSNIYPLEVPEFPQPRTETNPLNGNFITLSDSERLKNRKVFAVTINNHPDARPQNALTQADIVMEVLTEGGITRYVALFYENEPDKIGPVRSLRRYMIDFLAEYDSPVILHEGWAGFNESDSVYVRETDAIRDVFEFSMKTMQSPGSRYRDQKRIQTHGYVHSLYTSHDLIETEFERMSKQTGWESTSTIEELKWKVEDAYEDRGDFGSVDVTFLGVNDNISASGFKYNKDTNSYDRFILGKEDIDELNNQRISPKNVIYEWHNYRPANDGHSRIILTMIGEGEVTILRDGKKIDGTWKKTSRTDRTKYYDSEGKEIEINRGQIWKVILNKSGNQKFSTVQYK